jgi:hypothetical protein
MSSLFTTLSTLLLFSTLTTAQETHIVTLTSTAPISTITLAATTPSPTTTWTTPSTFQFSILNSTNYYRYLHPASYLQYNASLATFAQSYSQQCKWEHNPEIGPLGYGENLAKGFFLPSEAVDAWGNEAALFSFNDDDYTGFTEETGHFTQLVWRGSRTVGCGWTNCINGEPQSGESGDGISNVKRDGRTALSSAGNAHSSKSGDGSAVDGIFLVCNYYPAGNIMAPSDDGNDEYMFFKQNVVPERAEGAQGFNADEAGRGVGGPTATESVSGTVTANAANVLRKTEGVGFGGFGSLGVVVAGMVVGALL